VVEVLTTLSKAIKVKVLQPLFPIMNWLLQIIRRLLSRKTRTIMTPKTRQWMNCNKNQIMDHCLYLLDDNQFAEIYAIKWLLLQS
jgi:hypothetical protein